MEFIIFSVLILFFYIYSGIGLTFMLSPKNLEKYSLYFSPFVGLSYLSYFAWIFLNYSTIGSDVYAKWLLFPPIIFLITALAIKKERIGEIFWPFRKENILLITICVIIFTGISAPFLFKLNGLNTITLGNNDIAHYAATAKFITESSLVQYPIQVDEHFLYLIKTGAHFSAPFSGAIPSSIFSIEPYKIQNIVIYLFYMFNLPIVFLIGFEIFKYNKYVAMIITLLTGISYHLIYINYHGFMGQVIGTGMFLSLFLLMFYPILNCSRLSCFKFYVPLTVVFMFGLFISYSPLLPLFFVPLFIYLLIGFMSTKSVFPLLNALSFLSITIFITFMILPFAFIEIIKDLTLYKNAFGWGMYPLTPDLVFGLVGNNMWWQPFPFVYVYRIVLSLPILLVSMVSLSHLFKKERHVFYISISYIIFYLFLYTFFIAKELIYTSSAGETYKAYKLATYYIPIIFLACLYYFKDFNISNPKKITKPQIFGALFIILLIAGNIVSAVTIIRTNYYTAVPIKDSIIDLQKIAELDNVSSINVVEPPFWNQMWIYYFLFMEKKLYLEYTSYYPASPLLGEWTLQSADTDGVINIVNDNQNVIEINKDYYLVQNNLEAALGNGWYELESNRYAKWRWTGNNNDDPTLELYANKDNKAIDILLNYGSLDPNNEFSVFLDNTNIKDCKDKNSCTLNGIHIPTGKHRITFKPKLPPRQPGTGDPRTLGYAFSNIRIVVKGGEEK